MTVQFSTTLRDNMLAQIEALGASPDFEVWSGGPPANCAAADTGVLLGPLTAPAAWMDPPAGGSVDYTPTWTGAGVAVGVAGHFRMKLAGVCFMQGTMTGVGGGGDAEIQNVNIAVGQPLTMAVFTLLGGNA